MGEEMHLLFQPQETAGLRQADEPFLDVELQIPISNQSGRGEAVCCGPSLSGVQTGPTTAFAENQSTTGPLRS